MEGLIPMVCRSIKKNEKRRKYECISSGPAQTYDIEDFYTKEANDEYHDFNFSRKQHHPMTGSCGAHHRCYSSVDVYKPKQLVRFHSHRMFSCLNGA
ncbi:Unknown protein [Striga hermonthica]|uniref:Uncharacterized protein n=1 Tax=Striga hermonthica TaxID=68872 RepID=A0A9N7NMH2_STRHE|nr:Unknown protein [Striga hermonthica]